MSYYDFLKRKQKSITIYQDLDAVLNEPVSFKIVGEVHTLNPPSTEGFYRFIKSMNKLYSLSADSMTPDEIVGIYCEIILPLVPTLSKASISKMTIQQANALFSFVVETILGKRSDDFSVEEKKSLNQNIVRN